MDQKKEGEIQFTFCRICEVLCGLEVRKKDNRIVSIVPDRDHVATHGFACPKGLNQHLLYSSPDRVKFPLKRVNGHFEEISWHQALSEIGAKVRDLRSGFHPDTIAMYVGTAAGFGVLHPIFAQGFMTGIGSVSMFSSSTQDCSNKFAVASEVYGHPLIQPFPDLTSINCLIIVGANPLISKWSFLQVPDSKRWLKEIVGRGGKVFHIDPRKTESASAAGEHVFIRPGTDVFFYLSFLKEVLDRNAVDRDRITRFMTGFDELISLASSWPAEKTSEITGIPPETLRHLVSEYLLADGAALYCSTGVNMGRGGTIAFWIQECINAITGNLDRRGGTLVSKGIIDFPKFARKKGILTRSIRSRVGNCRSVNDAFPGGILADEILTPGDRQIRALFVTGGNPLITMADSEKLKKAFSKLELLVAVDILPNETASMAHYILPATTPLERPDLPFVFPLMLGLQIKPYLQATRPVILPEGKQRDEASIYLDLCRYSGVNLFNSAIAQKGLELFSGKMIKSGESLREIPQQGILNLLLKICRQEGFNSLAAHVHGKLQPGHQTGFLEKRVLTSDGKVKLVPEMLREAAGALTGWFETEKNNLNHFRLITRRAVKTHNSWTHNLESFVEPPENTNYLYMNPEDASELGISEGDTVDVAARAGSVRVPVRLLADLMPKTVALPHGWGHQHSGLTVAASTQGVNANILASSGPEHVDPVSGMSLLTGIVVMIKKSDQLRNIRSWSGI